MNGIFVTGTDTGVGKSVTCAWLVRNWKGDYWKPVQSGSRDGSDTDDVRFLARMPGDHFHPPAYRLRAPLSPHEAARQEGVEISLDALRLPATQRVLVVEGAGGVLTPLNDDLFMVDLMRHLGLPALVVARSGLGTINHTLLTLDALHQRGIPIRGVVLNGPQNSANKRAVEHYGRVKVLAELPVLAPLTAHTVATLPAPDFTP